MMDSNSENNDVSFHLEQSPSSVEQERNQKLVRGTAALALSGPMVYHSLPLGDIGSIASAVGGAGLMLYGANELYQADQSPDFTEVENPDLRTIKSLLGDEPELMMGSTKRNTRFSIPPRSTRDLKSYTSVKPRKAEGKFQNILDNTQRYDQSAETVDIFTVDEVETGWELWIEEKDMDDELVGSTAYRGTTDPSLLLDYDNSSMSFDRAIDETYNASL